MDAAESGPQRRARARRAGGAGRVGDRVRGSVSSPGSRSAWTRRPKRRRARAMRLTRAPSRRAPPRRAPSTATPRWPSHVGWCTLLADARQRQPFRRGALATRPTFAEGTLGSRWCPALGTARAHGESSTSTLVRGVCPREVAARDDAGGSMSDTERADSCARSIKISRIVESGENPLRSFVEQLKKFSENRRAPRAVPTRLFAVNFLCFASTLSKRVSSSSRQIRARTSHETNARCVPAMSVRARRGARRRAASAGASALVAVALCVATCAARVGVVAADGASWSEDLDGAGRVPARFAQAHGEVPAGGGPRGAREAGIQRLRSA